MKAWLPAATEEIAVSIEVHSLLGAVSLSFFLTDIHTL